jgi:phosphoglycerol transferase
MINLAPNLVYRLTHDKAAAAQRVPAEAEIYGLKIAQLLSPVTLHRLKSFAKFRETYDKTPLSNENIDSSLGLIGSVGFLFLIGWLLYRRGRDEADWSAELFNHLSLLNISAVLVGTIGGFGALFSHLVSPQIRAYNRISVFIAFFSLFSTALLLDRLSRRFFQQGSRRIAFYVLIPLLILLGVLDQTKKNFAPDYKGVKAEFLNDREFVRQIEAGVPERGMIFQLPVQVFPEGESYEHLKGYLHSDKLRWSYGAMRGREGGNWQAMVAAMPVSEMIDTIAVAGFSGVWIDRSLYPDSGAAIESAISTQLQTRPLLSPTQRRSFFNLIEYGKKIGGDPDKVIHPLIPKWQSGFSDLEGTPEDNWRWCSTTGEVRLENLSTRDRQVAIEMTASSLTKGKLKIEGKNFSETIQISPVNTPFSKQLTIPPGPYTIRFTSDTPAVQHLPDPRLLSFRINNFKMKEVEQ